MNKNKSNPFKIPEGYFDSFQENIMDKLSKKESILPKETAFKVPDGYFDVLSEKLMERLEDETKVVPLYPVKKVIALVASIAAVGVLLFGINWNKSTSVSFDDLANADIEAYFENNELDLTSYEIAEVIPVADTELSDILNSSIEDEQLLDYLNENINELDELNLIDNE